MLIKITLCDAALVAPHANTAFISSNPAGLLSRS